MASADSTVVSNWKITYDPSGAALVLVDFGDDLSDELILAWSQSIDPAGYTGATDMDFFARGKVSIPFGFGVVKAHASDVAMRNWMFAYVAALPVKETKPLKIEIQGGDSYQAGKCVLESVVPVPITNRSGAETLTNFRTMCSRFIKL